MGIENADLGIYASSTTPTLNLLRSYDDRGRNNYEAASSSAITGTDSSGGTITIGGSEQQVTKIASPGTATFTISGAEGTHQGSCIQYWPSPSTTCETYATVPDSGGFEVFVTTPTGTVTAGGGWESGGTVETVAQSLATSFTSQGFPATVGANGDTVTVQANVTGLSSNYPFTIVNGGGVNGGSDFSAGAQTGSWVLNSDGNYVLSSAFTGGWTGGTFYDTGTLSARISGTDVQVSWGQGGTPASLATSLAAAINSAAGTFVTATANGATVSLTSLSGGPQTDYTVTARVTDTNPFYFSDAPPSYYTGPQSFGVSTTNMSGGQTTSSLLYSFLIPDGTGYWPNGDLLHVTDSVTGTWSYGYDSLNRLAGTASSAGNYAGATILWSYDPFGNRTSETVSGSPSAPMPASSTAIYTAASNQVSSSSLNGGAAVGYDAAGEVTYDGLNSYLYDAEGRLCAVKNYVGSLTGYVYDAAGSRVAKGSLTSFSCNFSSNGFSTTSSYVLGPDGDQVTEYSVSGATSSWVHTDAFAAGGLVATYHDTATYFDVADWLGTKRAEVGTNGCTATFASLPYGNGLTASGTCPDATEHHFTGKERDTESGNDYFGARYYASAMGRFLSPDWASNPQAVPYGIFTNPQTLNLYNYMRNNPLSGVDKDGHCGGPNDPCSQVKVTTEQKDPSTGKPTYPQIVQNEKQPDGLVRSGVRAIVTDTITVGGKALPDKTLVSESNENTLTVNGKKIDAQTAQSPPTPTTDGKVGDVFGPLKSTTEPGSSQSFANALSGNAVTMTGKQTLTFDIPSGATCSATIERTLSNGSGGSTYTYTTTSGPTVTQAQPQPPQ